MIKNNLTVSQRCHGMYCMSYNKKINSLLLLSSKVSLLYNTALYIISVPIVHAPLLTLPFQVCIRTDSGPQVSLVYV